MKKFPFYKQLDQADCGPTCLRMITKYFGRNYTIQTLRALCSVKASGVTLLDISEAAEQIGLHSTGVKLDVKHLKNAGAPCIVHWRENHFVILYKVRNKRFYIADPASGMRIIDQNAFVNNWLPASELNNGNALFLIPTPQFYEKKGEARTRLNWTFILRYLLTYKMLLFQLLLALGLGTLIQLIMPFLTQSIVDIGINNQNIGFINIMLIGQLMLFVGSTTVEFIRSWILLHISTRVNISILTDFLIKLMKLPMSFFDTKTPGDIMQRIADEKRIESFLTGSALSIVFSFFNFIIFLVIIFFYNNTIFLVFTAATILYFVWIVGFLKSRKRLDYKQFSNTTKNQDNLFEIVNGIREIKLNNSELRKRWKWEHIQARVFRFTVRSMVLNQYQQAGALFINQSKNIFIIYFSAKAVIDGQITLGAMMAIQYIIGQLNGPVEQFISFIKTYQDAKISVERLNEIYALADEEPAGKTWTDSLPENNTITINDLTFRYPGAGNEPVLQDINLVINAHQTTAIVGMSGSGKTTLIKLLLRFFEPEKGEILVGGTKISELKFRLWRESCSAVLQDGYVFSDSVANNISLGDESFSQDKLDMAIKIANVQDVIDALPYGLHSNIGSGGSGISQGQRQRILIARAVYKNPQFIFFDEATNALDANNERLIVENLGEYLKDKTVVVIAHRLSTVKNADKIVVLDKGRIIEQGRHQELIDKKGQYFALIKNQLELGA